MTDSPATISALIIARDEATNLPGCLGSLDWVDERIVIVDPASRDATESLARRLADNVLVRPFDNFAAQRNAALNLARSDWVFAVDADERSSPRQAAEVRHRIRDHRYNGLRVPIRSHILGRPFRFSGTQNDLPLRLFRRDKGRWIGEVHETVCLDGPVAQLYCALEHQTLPNMQAFLAKLNNYTTLEAMKNIREGRPPRPGDLTLRPLWTFAKLFLARQGFRDGREGFAFCALSGLSVAVKHWKLRELYRAGRAH